MTSKTGILWSVACVVLAGCFCDRVERDVRPRVDSAAKAVVYTRVEESFEAKVKDVLQKAVANPDYACMSNHLVELLADWEEDMADSKDVEWEFVSFMEQGCALSARGKFLPEASANEVCRDYRRVVGRTAGDVAELTAKTLDRGKGYGVWTVAKKSGLLPAVGLGDDQAEVFVAFPASGIMVVADNYEALVQQADLYADDASGYDEEFEKSSNKELVVRVANLGSFLGDEDFTCVSDVLGVEPNDLKALFATGTIDKKGDRDRIRLEIRLSVSDAEKAKTITGALQLLKFTIVSGLKRVAMDDEKASAQLAFIQGITVRDDKSAVGIAMQFYLDELEKMARKRTDPAKVAQRRLERLSREAEGGDVDAMWKLGNAYLYGCSGAKKDVNKAFKYYSDAAERGDCGGLGRIGHCYEHGLGTEKDVKKAYEYYLKAANAGSGFAMNALGDCCEKGIGTETNLVIAVDWWKRAAVEKKHGWAACKVAIRHQKDKKPNEAFTWFRKAADIGSDYACCKLGECYERGWGTETNAVEAAKWFIKGAERRHAWGMEKAGDFYVSGYGVEKDTAKAREWYEKAVKRNGSKSAAKKLDALKGKEDTL